MAFINGTNGDNILNGTGSFDFIYGRNGNDTITGGVEPTGSLEGSAQIYSTTILCQIRQHHSLAWTRFRISSMDKTNSTLPTWDP